MLKHTLGSRTQSLYPASRVTMITSHFYSTLEGQASESEGHIRPDR